VTAETCQSSFDTVLADFSTGDFVPALIDLPTGIAVDDDINTCAGNALSSTLTFPSSLGNVDPYPATLTWTTIHTAPPPRPSRPPLPVAPPVFAPPPRPAGGPTPQARLTIAAQRLGTALRRGLVATIRANMAGTVTARATISGRLAVNLHLARRPQTMVVARAHTRLARPGVVKVVLRFTKAAKVRLAKARTAALTVRADVRSGSHAAASTTRVTLKR
jgi:hypothetical protein